MGIPQYDTGRWSRKEGLSRRTVYSLKFLQHTDKTTPIMGDRHSSQEHIVIQTSQPRNNSLPEMDRFTEHGRKCIVSHLEHGQFLALPNHICLSLSLSLTFAPTSPSPMLSSTNMISCHLGYERIVLGVPLRWFIFFF